jgi:hypothetical protein
MMVMQALPAAANGVPLASGDVLASVGNGLVDNYSATGTLQDTLNDGTSATYTTGGCFDSSGDFFVTNFDSDSISEFSPAGNLLNSAWATEPSTPESCTVDAHNNVYAGGPGSPTIYEYNSSGTQINSFPVEGGSGTGGTDWVDLEADQCTLLYTGEGSEILSYNVCTQTQNPDFATGLPAPCFELRIRPDGDVMVACASEVLRYSSSGTLLQTYAIPGTGELFSMNLDPDNSTFWTGDDTTGEIYHVNIATGAVISQFNSSPPVGLFGLTLVGAINVAQATLTLSPPTATKTVGTTDTVTATITNPGGSISGQTVNFSVAGANTASGTGVTNASGQATFSYTGTNAGTDTVTATFGSATGTASVTWTSPTSTQISTSLSGGGQSGAAISVPPGTPVTDTATLAGSNVATAGGTVTYTAYSNSTCTTAVGSPDTVTVTDGSVPASTPVTLTATGTYYWTASYSGDASNAASASACGTETAAVISVKGKAPVVDQKCDEHGTTSVTDSINPNYSGDLVVDYVAAQGPASGTQSVNVSGSGLTWTRVAQENSVRGDVEVWEANAGTLSTVSVTATAAVSGLPIAQTEVAYRNATGIGAHGIFSSASGAPTGTITTTQAKSHVWAVGFDPLTATSRTVGTGQRLANQVKAQKTTSWVQTTITPTPAAGTSVTINDTAPTTDPYDLILVEIL